MNRADRRRYNKKFKTNYNKEQMDAIELYAKLKAGQLNIKHLSDIASLPFVHIDPLAIVPNGRECKLRYDEIMSRPVQMNPKYVDFITKHKDDVLHVTRNKTEGSLVTVQEDPEGIWIFDIFADLLFKDAENGEWDII